MEEELTYWNEDENINKVLTEMKELKKTYKKLHLDIYMESYIRKLMSIARKISIKKYLLENIDTSVINIMSDLKIIPNTATINQICNDQELFEEYILCAGINILLSAPDSVYKFTIEGKPLIDYLFENDLVDKRMIDSIIGCPNILEYIKKYKKEALLDAMNPSDLLEPRGDKLLLDELIESGIKPNLKPINYTDLTYEILDRKAYYLLENVGDTLLEMRIEGMTLFEFLLKKGIVCKEALKTINYGRSKAEYFAKIIMDNKRYDLLLDLNESVLTNLSFNNKLALEYILENNMSPNIEYNSITSLEIITKLNKYEELQKCSQKLLLVKLKNGNRVIEEIFKRNLSIQIDDITNPEIAYYIYVNNRKDLYSKVRLSTWLMEYDDRNTYLDWIIIETKQNSNIKIKNIKEDISDIEEKAKIYIIFARHRIHEKYPFTKEELILSQNGKTLMQYLLEEDENITLNYLISEDLKQEKEISMIIRLNELRKKQKLYKTFSINTQKEYLRSLEKTFNFSRTTEEESFLLEELYNVMNDGKSSDELLYSLIAFYTYLFSIKNPYAYEVIKLIDIKRNNPDFHLIKSNGDYFTYKLNRVELESINPDILAHEIGHALFYYLTDKQLPQDIITQIKELRSSKEFLEITARHSKEYYLQRERVSKMVEEYYMAEYDKYTNEEEKERIREFLELEEELKKELGYFIFPGRKPTPEEVISRNREIQKEQLVSFIMRVEYGYILSISDIIDAIHEGNYQQGNLVDNEGNNIIGCAGHGTDYYKRGDIWVIDEIMANISEIMKSSNPQEGIKLLKEYIGEDLANKLIKYYEENILYSKKYEESIIL